MLKIRRHTSASPAPQGSLRTFNPQELQEIADFVTWYEYSLMMNQGEEEEISKAFAWGIRNWLSGDTLPIPCDCAACEAQNRARGVSK